MSDLSVCILTLVKSSLNLISTEFLSKNLFFNSFILKTLWLLFHLLILLTPRGNQGGNSPKRFPIQNEGVGWSGATNVCKMLWFEKRGKHHPGHNCFIFYMKNKTTGCRQARCTPVTERTGASFYSLRPVHLLKREKKFYPKRGFFQQFYTK